MSKSRTHWIVLYPDDLAHVQAKEKLENDLYRYSGILHDKDVSEEGYKKPHWNLLVKFSSPRSADSVANELGIQPNYIKYVGNTKSAERYHLHLDNPDRGVYSITELFGTDLDSVVKSCSAPMSESAEVVAIMDLIDSYTCSISLRIFLQVICEHELYSTFRRMGALGISLLNEHNRKYTKRYDG